MAAVGLDQQPASSDPSKPAITPFSAKTGVAAPNSTPSASRKATSKRAARRWALAATAGIVILLLLGGAFLMPGGSETPGGQSEPTDSSNPSTTGGSTSSGSGDPTSTPSVSQTTTTTSRTDQDSEIEVTNRLPELDLVAPADNAINVPLDQVLEWDASDADDDALTFDVFLGTGENDLVLLCDNIQVEACSPQSLSEDQIYYWKVVADDGNDGVTESDVWTFTTEIGGGENCVPLAVCR